MAFLSIIFPQPKIYTRTLLHGIGRAETDADFRANLRLIVAVLLANWEETHPNLTGVVGDIFDVITSETFYNKGIAKTIEGEVDVSDDIETKYANLTNPQFPANDANNARLWFCSYVGFERVTSKWAKENHPDCHGVVCMRLYNQDARHNVVDSHTVQIYF